MPVLPWQTDTRSSTMRLLVPCASTRAVFGAAMIVVGCVSWIAHEPPPVTSLRGALIRRPRGRAEASALPHNLPGAGVQHNQVPLADVRFWDAQGPKANMAKLASRAHAVPCSRRLSG